MQNGASSERESDHLYYNPTIHSILCGRCHACKAFGPIYDAVAKEYSSPGLIQFLKFDGGSDREFAAPLIDDAFPGVALLHGNRLVDRMKAVRTVRITAKTS